MRTLLVRYFICFICLGVLVSCSSKPIKARADQTSSPDPRKMAQEQCPIALPDSAQNVQFFTRSEWIAHNTYVRFKAPAADCLKHAKVVLKPDAERLGGSVISKEVVGPPSGYRLPDDLKIPWFDLDRFNRGTLFHLTGSHGPVVWVDTVSEYFYFIDED